jgi:CDP-diacylglycerol pyrophosphatase
MKRKLVVAAALAVSASIILAVVAWTVFRPNPDALWQIVSEQCVPQARDGAAHNRCAKVDLAAGYAVFKDRNGIGQYLLIPTDRVAGIESPQLVAPGAPNYWQAAWQARGYLEQALQAPLQRQQIGLAINSVSGRSQNQLHIHIDCMQPGVATTLAVERNALGDQWSDLPLPLAGHHYRARLIDDAALATTDPFRLLFDDIQPRGEVMADQTLLLTGTTLPGGRPGFILLNNHVRPGDNASAEELLDHSCSVRD